LPAGLGYIEEGAEVICQSGGQRPPLNMDSSSERAGNLFKIQAMLMKSSVGAASDFDPAAIARDNDT